MIYDYNIKCPTCNVDYKSLTAVSLHYRNKHGTSQELKEQLRIQYVNVHHNGIVPTCKCGCGQVPKYYDHNQGYMEYVRGHHARVANNWGHNQVAQRKSQDVRREMHQRGEIKIWNKDETKETDARIAAYGKKGSYVLKNDPQHVQQRSEHMQKQWETNSIVPLYGKDSSQWKGGTSALQPVCRSRVFNTWARPKLEEAKYICQFCHATDGRGVVVHHDGERFAKILHKAIEMFGEIDETVENGDFEKKSKIADWVTEYHQVQDVSGLVLCESCHQITHSHDKVMY